jgi:2-polyprenyl-3-methyl-5-hydroxy-6-metoxy-1,4-benzoquinol methylase
MRARRSTTEPGWNHNVAYQRVLLRAMPSLCRTALDVGCGDGTLLQSLHQRAATVVGIDASAAMIDRARANVSARGAQLIHGDVLTYDFGGRRFDFIACVAAIHHVEFRTALARLASLLERNGTLAVVGLARSSSARDVAFDAAGFAVSRLLRMRHALHDPGAPLAATTMTYADVERIAAGMLPGVSFRRLLLFRYLLTWTKPA